VDEAIQNRSCCWCNSVKSFVGFTPSSRLGANEEDAMEATRYMSHTELQRTWKVVG
jgi:hypothetical protein